MLPWFVYPCMELCASHSSSFPRSREDPSPYRVLRGPECRRASDVPGSTSHPACQPYVPCCCRRPVGRHYESVPRMAHQRRQRMAEKNVSYGEGEYGLLYPYLGSPEPSAYGAAVLGCSMTESPSFGGRRASRRWCGNSPTTTITISPSTSPASRSRRTTERLVALQTDPP